MPLLELTDGPGPKSSTAARQARWSETALNRIKEAIELCRQPCEPVTVLQDMTYFSVRMPLYTPATLIAIKIWAHGGITIDTHSRSALAGLTGHLKAPQQAGDEMSWTNTQLAIGKIVKLTKKVRTAQEWEEAWSLIAASPQDFVTNRAYVQQSRRKRDTNPTQSKKF
jgi:hypothetical protein